MTSKLVVNTIEADTGISSVSFASSISLSSTSKFHFSAAGIDIDADTNINRPAAGVIGFNINSSEKVRIQSNGRVGISTDNPVSALHVLGTTHALGNGGASLVWGDSVYLGALTFDGSAQPVVRAASGKSLVVQVNQSTEALRITSDGKMGLGITAPAGMFEVQKNGVPAIIANYNNSKHIQMGAGGSGAGFHLTTGNFFTINHQPFADRGTDNNLTERLRITSGGQVIISNSNPPSTGAMTFITDDGSATTLGTAATLRVANDGSSANYSVFEAQSSSGSIRLANNGKFYVSGGQTKINITSDGALTEPLVIRNGGTGQNTNVGMVFYNGNESSTGAGALARIKALDVGGYDSDLVFETGLKTGWSNTTTERLRISAQGYVTKPNHPAFIAGRTGGNQTFTVGTFPLNVARLNVGNHYNTSTYKFVAPVAGVYYFYAQVYYNNGAGQYRMGFRKTPSGGSAFMLNTSSHKIDAGHPSGANDTTDSTSIVESLAVGDSVELYCDQNHSIQCYYNINDNTYGAHTYFMGYLIG